MAEQERHGREHIGGQPGGNGPGTSGFERDVGAGDEGPASGERAWAVVAHLSGIVSSVVGPLLVMVIAGRTSAFARDQAREAVNFQFTVLGGLVAALIAFSIFIGPVLLVIVAAAAIVLSITAAVRAGRGLAWRYPFATRLVR